jgi:hypothetical protein
LVAPVGGLVGELSADLTQAGVGQAPPEPPFAVGHTRHVEVFDGDDVERSGQDVGEPVEVQHTGLGDLAVEAGASA